MNLARSGVSRCSAEFYDGHDLFGQLVHDWKFYQQFFPLDNRSTLPSCKSCAWSMCLPLIIRASMSPKQPVTAGRLPLEALQLSNLRVCAILRLLGDEKSVLHRELVLTTLEGVGLKAVDLFSLSSPILT